MKAVMSLSMHMPWVECSAIPNSGPIFDMWCNRTVTVRRSAAPRQPTSYLNSLARSIASDSTSGKENVLPESIQDTD